MPKLSRPHVPEAVRLWVGHLAWAWRWWGWLEERIGQILTGLLVVGLIAGAVAVVIAWSQSVDPLVAYLVLLFVPLGVFTLGSLTYAALTLGPQLQRTGVEQSVEPGAPPPAPAPPPPSSIRVQGFVLRRGSNKPSIAVLRVDNAGPEATLRAEMRLPGADPFYMDWAGLFSDNAITLRWAKHVELRVAEGQYVGTSSYDDDDGDIPTVLEFPMPGGYYAKSVRTAKQLCEIEIFAAPPLAGC